MPSSRGIEEGAQRRSSRTQTRQRPPSTLGNMRAGINDMFTGRSRVGRERSPSPERPLPEQPLDSPKTPRLVLGLQNFSSTRLAIPYLNRTSMSLPNTPIAENAPPTPISPRPIIAPITRQTSQPAISTVPSHVRHNSARRFNGVDPAELHLAELAEAGRRRRKRKAKKERGCCAGCGPKIKHKQIRRKILACIISGLILVLVLTIYLALALNNRNESQEFHVLLILVILIVTIFFCHSLIRLCMLILHPPLGGGDVEQGRPSMAGPRYPYANPVVPIQVTLARDEEAVGIESTATKLPPPAYGLWRESVRVDPNRLYWQRNLAPQRRHSQERPTTATRPPSYISENGVDYVVEAVGRSTAPTTDVPLHVHPSERGRTAMI